jgi:hypothetical protein
VSANGYYSRLAAATIVAGILGLLIANPDFGRRTAARAEEARSARLDAAEPACAPGEAPLTGGFADLAQVLAVAPLGPARPPGAAPAAPFIRVLPKPATGGGRAALAALAPGKVDVVAIESREERTAGGGRAKVNTVRFRPCDGVIVVYDGLEEIDATLMRRARAAADFLEAPDGSAALAARVRLREGDVIGRGPGFTVALADLAAPAARHAAPAPGREIPAYDASAFETAPALVRALAFDESRARCPLDYLEAGVKAAWTEKFADWRGVRLAVGGSGCARASPAAIAPAMGPWYTDSSHNARVEKIRAILLADDPIAPDRLVFALDGVLRSLVAEMIDAGADAERQRRDLARGPVTFEPRDGRINAPFIGVRENETYCYEDLRAGFSGPAVNGVLLMRIERSQDQPPLLRLEARAEAAKCLDLPEPWTFSGGETSFYRRG